MKKFIGIDVDGVLSLGFHDQLVEFFNENTSGNPLIIKDLHYDIREYFHKSDVPWRLGRALVECPGFVEGFSVIPESLDFVNELRREGFGIKIITAPYIGARSWVHERAQWLVKHFKMNHDDIIFTRGKEAVTSVETLIDDKIENCQKWSAATDKKSYLMARPWNEHFKVFDVGNNLIQRTNSFNFILNDIIQKRDAEKDSAHH